VRPRSDLAPELSDVIARAGSVADDPLDADVLVLPVAPDAGEGVEPRAGVVDAAVRYGIDLGDLAVRARASGVAGDTATVELPRAHGDAHLLWSDLPHRLVLVGIGDGGSTAMRRAGAAAARATRGQSSAVTSVALGADVVAQQAFLEGFLLGAYNYPPVAGSSLPDASAPVGTLVVLGVDSDAVARAESRAWASWVARVLTATPASLKNPQWICDRAAELADDAGLEYEILDEKQLAAHGFGGLLAVGNGAMSPPRLMRITYRPTRRQGARVVLVGKGITYDTGGISLKPSDSMVPMKTDMAGSAVALATVLGAARAGVTHEVTALLPLAENAIGASSYRPGDVVTVRGGTTVEIANTDAEGRMVLADALVHADLTLDPDVVVDVATLTGAATLALGRTHGALFTTDDLLADAMLAAGDSAGERLWRMPLVVDYAEALDSEIADVRHVAGDGFTGAGAITAALFLQRFAGRRRWVHLDIAGPARATAVAHEMCEGATGFGVRALLTWLDGDL
jgi:leucyl aminopeptidase